MPVYYNEIDPFCVEWLNNLIAAGHIAPGHVDNRDIKDVTPNDLKGYTQQHFFAGIGVWSYALRLAGWADDRPVWTGSCPCQPFSAAGKGAGFDDPRHLWPDWYWLIQECRPAIIFGEQVASKSVGPWIDLVQTNLETLDYAFGCVPFPSAGVGAPHIRDRAYWMAHADDARPQGRGRVRERADQCAVGSSGMANGMADAESAGRRERSANALRGGERGSAEGLEQRSGGVRFLDRSEAAGPTNRFWQDADWLNCRDEKWRPVEPGTFPLVDGAPSRVGRLRAYGNAINAQQAKEFITAFMQHQPRS